MNNNTKYLKLKQLLNNNEFISQLISRENSEGQFYIDQLDNIRQKISQGHLIGIETDTGIRIFVYKLNEVSAVPYIYFPNISKGKFDEIYDKFKNNIGE